MLENYVYDDRTRTCAQEGFIFREYNFETERMAWLLWLGVRVVFLSLIGSIDYITI
jgi:hypothetical protein